MSSNEENKIKTVGFSNVFHILGFKWGSYDITFFSPTARQPLLCRTSSLSRLHDHPQTHGMAGLEPVTAASKRPQTHVLDRAATGFGIQ
jgi:hypothetical protein